METKKQTETLISQACATVPGFTTIWKGLERKIVLDGNSNSTLTAYGRSVAQLALHFNKDPMLLEDEQVNEYLYQLNRNGKKSESYFKFAVFVFVICTVYSDEKIKPLHYLHCGRRAPCRKYCQKRNVGNSFARHVC